jgi:hypothetical protein
MNEHVLIQNLKRKDMAIAFRVARNANEREWRKFIRRK